MCNKNIFHETCAGARELMDIPVGRGRRPWGIIVRYYKIILKYITYRVRIRIWAVIVHFNIIRKRTNVRRNTRTESYENITQTYVGKKNAYISSYWNSSVCAKRFRARSKTVTRDEKIIIYSSQPPQCFCNLFARVQLSPYMISPRKILFFFSYRPN